MWYFRVLWRWDHRTDSLSFWPGSVVKAIMMHTACKWPDLHSCLNPTLNFRGTLIYFINLKKFPNCNFKMEKVPMIVYKTKSKTYSLKPSITHVYNEKTTGGCKSATVSERAATQVIKPQKQATHTKM